MQRNLTTLGGTTGKGRRELDFGELSLNQGPGLGIRGGWSFQRPSQSVFFVSLERWGGVYSAEVAAGRCDVDVRWQVSDGVSCRKMDVCNVFSCREWPYSTSSSMTLSSMYPSVNSASSKVLTESLEPPMSSRVPFPLNRPCPTCQPRMFLLLYVRSSTQQGTSDTVSYVAGHKGPAVLREPPQLSGRGPPAPNAGMQPGVSQHRLFSWTEKRSFDVANRVEWEVMSRSDTTSYCLPSTSHTGGGNDELSVYALGVDLLPPH